MATEFAVSRFCVPFLAKSGWALFVDSDIVCQADILELFQLAADPDSQKHAIMVVKHQQAKGPAIKMDGQLQTFYARKNWSSVVLWNCDHPAHKALTRAALNEWPGRDLHAFKWLKDEDIGELAPRWNQLVGVETTVRFGGREFPQEFPSSLPGILHFTLGGPWLPDWKGGPLDDVWLREAATIK